MQEKTFLFYRIAAGITQQALADKLGLTKENISAWERGKKNIPKKHCAALAKILHISVDDILCLNAIRKSNLQRNKANFILSIQDKVEKNFPEEDMCFKNFRQLLIWEIFQQNWSDDEKVKFANFIASYDTGYNDFIKSLKQEPKMKG